MSMTIRRSLAAQLYFRTLLLIAGAGMVMAGILFLIVRHDINTRADQQLVTATQVLLLLMREEFDNDDAHPTAARDAPGERLLSDEDISAFQASANWRQFAVFHRGIMTVRPAQAAAIRNIAPTPGFDTFTIGDEAWRSYGLIVPDHKLVIVVAEPVKVRSALILQIGERLILPIIILVIGSALLLWLTLRRGLSAVDRLGAVIGHRSAAELDPLHVDSWPSDLTPIVAALNNLLERVKTSFEHEQAFADNAAHQLRTPLAALKVRAQLMLKDAAPQSEAHAALSDLLISADRASETITQMLRLARLDTTALRHEQVDLRELASEIIADRALLATRAGIAFSLTAPDNTSTSTDSTPLRVALAAIVDNAIEHAAGGAAIDLEISRVGQTFAIAVGDRGPGIAADRRAALLREGDGPWPGVPSGLGLAIARRAVALLGGTLTLEDRADGPGLRAVILLPD